MKKFKQFDGFQWFLFGAWILIAILLLVCVGAGLVMFFSNPITLMSITFFLWGFMVFGVMVWVMIWLAILWFSMY